MDVESRVAERASCLAATFVEHVADRHRGASLDHQPRRLAADAARCPGDQRHLSVQSVHRRPSPGGSAIILFGLASRELAPGPGSVFELYTLLHAGPRTNPLAPGLQMLQTGIVGERLAAGIDWVDRPDRRR